MKLLPHPATKAAKPVKSWADIRDDAFDMLELLNAGNFSGLWKEGVALSHSQVSNDPYDFFVTHKSFIDVLPRVVCNSRLLEYSARETFKEACMSYPLRPVVKTLRWWSVTVEFEVPPIDGIKALLGLNRLTKTQGSYDGLTAFVFQHEIDHARAVDIYHK